MGIRFQTINTPIKIPHSKLGPKNVISILALEMPAEKYVPVTRLVLL